MSEHVDDKDIRELFDRVAEQFDETDDGIRSMFSMLVETTLKYRDTIRHSRGETLSVGETRNALGVFMEVLQAHSFPEGIDEKIKGLVIVWLEELKKQTHN